MNGSLWQEFSPWRHTGPPQRHSEVSVWHARTYIGALPYRQRAASAEAKPDAANCRTDTPTPAPERSNHVRGTTEAQLDEPPLPHSEGAPLL